jgi:excisionase family DNA binding protein
MALQTPVNEPDVSGWPTIPEAAVFLAVSPRTIERKAERGEIDVRKRERPGKKPENVVNPADVERLRPKSHVVVRHVMNEEPQTDGMPAKPFDVLGALIALVTQQQKLLTAPAPCPWITVQEAAELSGLSAAFIRRQIAETRIAATRGGPHGALRVHRASLMEFRGAAL